MDYDEFKAEYRKVWDALDGNRPAADFAPDLARLKTLASTIENPVERRSADNDVADLEGVLAEDDEPTSPAMTEAIRAHGAASVGGGTPAERIARAEAGMAEIARISEAAEPADSEAILELNESLYMLIMALAPDAE